MKIDRCRTRSSEQGAVYVLAVVGMVVTAAAASTYLSFAVDARSRGRASVEEQGAREIAESALNVALAELRAGVDLAADGLGVMSGRLGGGDFQVSITPPYGDGGPYLLRGIGSYGRQQQGVEALVEELVGQDFCLHSARGVSGTVFSDSYDSSAGSYASQAVNVDPDTGDSYAGSAGHVASNGPITLSGGTNIHGNATPGPGEAVTLGGSAYVRGSMDAATETVTFPTPVYQPPVASAGSLVLSGAWQTLNSGTYRYTDASLKEELTIDGDVELYIDSCLVVESLGAIKVTPGSRLRLHLGGTGASVTKELSSGMKISPGDVYIAGKGVINGSGDPSAVEVLYSGDSSNTLYWGGSSVMAATIMAPEALFSPTGKGDFYGKVVCGEAYFGGQGRFHFDTQLMSGSGGGEFRVLGTRDFTPR